MVEKPWNELRNKVLVLHDLKQQISHGEDDNFMLISYLYRRF